MATANVPVPAFNRAEADRRVRHPLHAIRGWIRRYVLIEGLALAVLYVAACFWLWLLFDYGSWKLLAFDWLFWFTELAEGSGPTVVLRGALLLLVGGGLAVLIALKLIRRFFKEFSDGGVALLLEKRYPNELGDRLITAVELADPRIAEKYGFSQPMLDATIRDAAERVSKLPAYEIFRWGRLRLLVALAVLLTVGLYLAVGAAWCAVNGAGPVEFAIRFHQTASIWAERNLLMADSYWPPATFLELIRFANPELRVPREEDRPDVKARHVTWAIASAIREHRGWRALRFHDLKDILPAAMLKIDLPATWPGWVAELDDLDPSVPAGAIPREWGWDGASTGKVRAELGRPEFMEVLDRSDAGGPSGSVRESIYKMLDYHNWTVDAIQHQLEPVGGRESAVAAAMKAQHPREYEQLQAIFAKLQELAADPLMARTLRRMVAPNPDEVIAQRKSKTGGGVSRCSAAPGGKYLFSLAELKESCQFSIVANDFWTPWKRITLVPPPMIDQLRIDKEEPAYLYYRLDNPQLLKGKRQTLRSMSVSVTGAVSRIMVPFGTAVSIAGHCDRKLKDIRVAEPDAKKREEKISTTPAAAVTLDADGQSFTCSLGEVRRTLEFDFEFKDDDNVRGLRRVLIVPVEDQAPRIHELALATAPRVLPQTDETAKGIAAGPRFVITPDAYLKWRGKVEDDHALSRLQYKYELQEIEFQPLLIEGDGKGGEGKEQPEPKKSARGAGVEVVLGGLTFNPGPTCYGFYALSYFGGIAHLVKESGLPPPPPRIDTVALLRADQKLKTKFESDVTPAEMLRLLAIEPAHRKLLLEALDLTPKKETLAGFMQRLKDANVVEGFLREAIDFAGVPARGPERDRLTALAATDPAQALIDVLRMLKADPAALAAARTLLEKRPETLLIQRMNLQDEDLYYGFDVREQLRFVKAVATGAERPKQKHYALRITIVATDNNIETGPGVTTANLQYNFLIISEDELLGLMVNDQRLYQEALQKAVDELEKTRGGLEGQLLDYKNGTNDDLTRLMVGLVGRAEMARKSVRDGGITVKAVHGKLDGLLREMEFNRLKKDRVDKFRERIVEPLGALVAADGAIARLDERALKFVKELTIDVDKKEKADAAQKGDDPAILAPILANKSKHARAAEQTLIEMTDLIAELRKVLDVLKRAVTDDQLLEMAIYLDQGQRMHDIFIREYAQRFQQYLRALLKGD
jgi:hypothetical protein